MSDFSTYFKKSSFFKLKPISVNEITRSVQTILLPDEKIIGAYKKVRDQVIFTDKRVIDIDMQGITGKKKRFYNFPYSKVQYFAAQTPGLVEMTTRDAEILLAFADGAEICFEFLAPYNSNYDYTEVLKITQVISQYVLK